MRSPCTAQSVAPALCNKKKALAATKTQHSSEDPAKAKINRYIKLFKKRKPLMANIMKGLELRPKDLPAFMMRLKRPHWAVAGIFQSLWIETKFRLLHKNMMSLFMADNL